MERTKIFVSAYACEPDRGSEPGVGWHWVLEMSKYYDLWVLTRANNKEKIEKWISGNCYIDDIHFLYYDLPLWIRPLKKSAIGLWIYYFLWQWLSNKVVKNTMIDQQIKVFHHITFGNALFPVSRYGRKQFFIWGPVGGAGTLPLDFIHDFPFWSKVKECLQYLFKYTARYNLGFIHRCKTAKLILCKTDELIKTIPERFRDKCVQFTDVAIDTDKIIPCPSILKEKETFNYLAVGTLEAWRNFDILIEAFTTAHRANDNIRLKIVGNGYDRKRLEKLTLSHNANDYILFVGALSQEEYENEMQSADVVINPSYREGSVTMSFDAVKFGKPLICFETGGYTHHFNENFCLIIKNAESKDKAIAKLAEAIKEMSDWDKIKDMSQNALNARKDMSWEVKGRDIRSLFETCFT